MSRAFVSVLALVLLAGCNWGPFKKDESPPDAQPTATPQQARARLTPPPMGTPTPGETRIEVEPLEDQTRERRTWQEEREAGPRATKHVRLPVAVRHGKKLVPAGRYEVQLDTTGEDPFIVLVRDGAEVARSLAVRPVKQPGRQADGSWLWKDTREETLIRIFSQRGNDLYFAVFEAEE